jgi:BirA family transcriptional regulator, biotin operon repressor / biotin---[acetyl-CoA-carboxylase] ligase
MKLDPRALAAGVRLAAHEEIDSTNAQALRLARQGERGPLWISAARQSAGRGRRGRTWISPPGNLYASLLLNAETSPERWPQVSFVAALAARDAVAALVPGFAPSLALKWPNDLLLGGDKLAGILIEGESAPSAAIVIGVGVNCVSHPCGLDFPATDLRAAGASVTAADLITALSGTMLARLAQWDLGAGFAAIRADWLACAAWLGEDIRVQTAESEIAGRFVGLDDDGGLLIEARAGRTTIRAGDVVAPNRTLLHMRGGGGRRLAPADRSGSP